MRAPDRSSGLVVALCFAALGGCSGSPGGDGGPDLAMGGQGPDLLRLPSPTITGVTPDHGPTSGGTTLVVLGTNFYEPATVEIDGVKVLPKDVAVSPAHGSLKAQAPERPGRVGPVSVKVTNPDGQSAILDKGYRYELSTIAFGAATAFPSGAAMPQAGPTTGALVDLDGDKAVDLVLCLPFDQKIAVLRGAGDGTLRAPATSAEGARPVALIAADLDGARGPDIITAQSATDRVGVRLNDGRGGLSAITTTALDVMSAPVSLAAADLDGDGKLDLAVVSRLASSVVTLPGTGGGALGAARSWMVSGPYPGALAVGHFGDAKHFDLVVNDASGTAALSRLPGLDGGAFGAEVRLTQPSGVQNLVAVDLDKDGLDDLVTAGSDGSGVRVLRGTPGGFGPPATFAAGTGAFGLAWADFDLDGRTDLATTDPGGSAIYVLPGKGDGSFGAAVRAASNTPLDARWLAAGDLNGDGLPDLVEVSLNSTDVQVFLNQSK